MARTIKFTTECFYCKKLTEKGKGYLERKNNRFYAHCFDCYKIKKEKMKIQRVIADEEVVKVGDL